MGFGRAREAKGCRRDCRQVIVIRPREAETRSFDLPCSAPPVRVGGSRFFYEKSMTNARQGIACGGVEPHPVGIANWSSPGFVDG